MFLPLIAVSYLLMIVGAVKYRAPWLVLLGAILDLPVLYYFYGAPKTDWKMFAVASLCGLLVPILAAMVGRLRLSAIISGILGGVQLLVTAALIVGSFGYVRVP